MTGAAQVAVEIYREAMAAMNVRAAVRRAIHVDDATITIAGQSAARSMLKRVLIIAMGKSAMAMYEAAEEALRGMEIDTLVVAPQELERPVRGRFFAGAHPLPDATSFAAARATLDLLDTADEETAVLFLISGGASAMVELPLDEAITVDDVAQMHRSLVASGLRIAEMNAVRKHVSAVKGGRLAVAARKAHAIWTLFVSDVPPDDVATIASGPTVGDPTTVEECRAFLRGVRDIPESVVRFVASDLCVETPDSVPGAHAVVLSSVEFAEAARAAAESRGFRVVVDTSMDELEYADAAEQLMQYAADSERRLCVVSTGEVQVTLPREHGRGGRNMQFALMCALTLRGDAAVLSAGSDGVDGNSGAAGGVVDETIRERAAAAGLDIEDALQRFDAASILEQVGGVVSGGPTGLNVRDLRLLVLV